MLRLGWYQKEVLREYSIKTGKVLGVCAALIPVSYGVTALMDSMRPPEKVTPSQVFFGVSKIKYFGAPGIEFERQLEVTGRVSNCSYFRTQPKMGDKPNHYQQIISGSISDSDQSGGYVSIPFQVTQRSYYPIKEITLKDGEEIKIIGTYNKSFLTGFDLYK
jgi:hypothetical protein